MCISSLTFPGFSPFPTRFLFFYSHPACFIRSEAIAAIKEGSLLTSSLLLMIHHCQKGQGRSNRAHFICYVTLTLKCYIAICMKQIWSLIINSHNNTITHTCTYHNNFIRTSLGGENEKATSQLVAGEGLSAEPFSCCWNDVLFCTPQTMRLSVVRLHLQGSVCQSRASTSKKARLHSL